MSRNDVVLFFLCRSVVLQRCHEEREARLKSLTANIQRSMAKATPVRTTKLAYVESVAKPSRSAAKSQVSLIFKVHWGGR